jgi:hypothetical protein
MKPGEKYEEDKVAERLRDHSLYIAFAPLEGPKIALAVLGRTAASARALRRRSRARCSITSCSASCRASRGGRRPRPK